MDSIRYQDIRARFTPVNIELVSADSGNLGLLLFKSFCGIDEITQSVVGNRKSIPVELPSKSSRYAVPPAVSTLMALECPGLSQAPSSARSTLLSAVVLISGRLSRKRVIQGAGLLRFISRPMIRLLIGSSP